MTAQINRHRGTAAIATEGWSVERLTPASGLFGSNGIRTGPDGRVYVAQVGGSQVSAVDVDTGAVETISPMDGNIVAPDDLVFDEAGNLYLTEITENRVSMLAPNGTTRVIQGDMPVANPITYHQGRLIAGECRVGARIMELDRNGGAPRVILADVPMVNAFDVGPDGLLYFPVMGTNEIWRISLEGGAPEVVAGDLGVPDSVKFDRDGNIITTQVASGQVLKIDPRTGERTLLADLGPGLDNSTFVGDRLFVSSIPGELTEILAPGETRSVIPRGLQWPLGLAEGEDGTIFVCDGAFAYFLKPGSELQLAGMLFYPGFPGYVRGVTASSAGEWIVTTGTGQVSRFKPAASESEVLATGYDQLMGVDSSGGSVIVAEFGTGRVLSLEGGSETELASGIDQPMGVAIADGSAYVAEAGAGRVLKVAGGRSETVAEEDSRDPEGLAFSSGKLYVVDSVTKTLTEMDTAGGSRRTIAENLAVGGPPGVTPPVLGPVGDMAGPMIRFSDVTAARDGTLYVGADAEGSVLAVRQQ